MGEWCPAHQMPVRQEELSREASRKNLSSSQKRKPEFSTLAKVRLTGGDNEIGQVVARTPAGYYYYVFLKHRRGTHKATTVLRSAKGLQPMKQSLRRRRLMD